MAVCETRRRLLEEIDRPALRASPATQPVCTENLIRVDDVMESPKLAE
jgi:hypothetical protein